MFLVLSLRRRFWMTQASHRFGLASQLIHSAAICQKRTNKNNSLFSGVRTLLTPNLSVQERGKWWCVQPEMYKMYITGSSPELVPAFSAFSNASGERPISYCSNERSFVTTLQYSSYVIQLTWYILIWSHSKPNKKKLLFSTHSPADVHHNPDMLTTSFRWYSSFLVNSKQQNMQCSSCIINWTSKQLWESISFWGRSLRKWDCWAFMKVRPFFKEKHNFRFWGNSLKTAISTM